MMVGRMSNIVIIVPEYNSHGVERLSSGNGEG